MSKKVTIALISIIIALVVGSQVGDSQIKKTSAEIVTKNVISPTQTAILRQDEEGVVVLDVRTQEERDIEHVDGSEHIDSVDVQNGKIPEFSKDAEVYVYCRSGNRAGQVISILEKEGYGNLVNIGGLEDWKDAGGKTVSD